MGAAAKIAHAKDMAAEAQRKTARVAAVEDRGVHQKNDRTALITAMTWSSRSR
jgi:hypothetical protein